uniref:Imelysin-like domain-containing protein n=1 Tax=Pinguiococcus pyrenoidosus TaxID=172671 RepID=A0A7R9U856_9STRA|mmetsp:Transcript_1867/g.8301  ORF Transcript_1867/g.8301 Transcript_1867/m.8301 type:complete len:161 (+) Transcript_1867:249-731(+)
MAAVPAMLALGQAKPANALSSSDENRLRTGYKNLNYLLENWDKETTKCNAAGGCVRTPDNIRYYLGMRSTTDPLFQVEKLFIKAGADIDGEDGERFEDALNEWNRHVEQANIMAYTSSWGEANPGGGQDRINQFATKAFNEVQLARDALGTMVDVLNVSL